MLKRAASLLTLLLFAWPLAAQGVRTGTLTGIVRSGAGDPVEGVTVTVSSPALQGTRTAATDANGGYILKGLPPGAYKVAFTQGTLKVAEQTAEVTMGEAVQVDVKVGTAKIDENVEVTAPSSPLGESQGGEVLKADEMDLLPVGRDPVSTAALAPGVTTNTANSGQVSVSGGFGYDNVFLVDGVDINDNVFGSPTNLYIEEAVEETQVLTSGVPAEFGRFAGGVVNVVSKKGANRWSGSFRTDLANTSWRSLTPFERENGLTLDDRLSKIFQGTLGGPAIKDRLWFFLAGRSEKSAFASVLDRSRSPYTARSNDQRYSFKITGRLAEGHTIESAFLTNANKSYGPSFPFSIDPATLKEGRYPASLFVANYSGVFRDNLFGELQYSQKAQGFRDVGGTSSDIHDSPFLTATQSLAHYNAPYFDGNDPEDRNNRQLTGTLSYYLTTRHWGRHDLKGGFEHFNTKLVGGNSPSSTSIVFSADYKADALGQPIFDSTGHLIPLFEPGTSSLSLGLADRGATLKIRTLSFFLQDSIRLSSEWSIFAGLRYEAVKSDATGGVVGVDTNTVVPRLAVTSRPFAGWRFTAGFAEYAGKYNESQFGQNTSVGNPEFYDAIYVGPRGEGRSFNPGFDLRNYAIVSGSFPTANVFFAPGLSSPVAREYTLSTGRNVGRHTAVHVTFTDRKLRNFVEDYITIGGGFTDVVRQGIDFGDFDNQIYRNSNEPKRHYQAVTLTGQHRIVEGWRTAVYYTLQLKNNGNFNGEATNRPAISSLVGNYPEILVPARNFPEGRLFGYEKHNVTAWSRYRFDLRRLGHVDLSGLWRFDSGLTYSLVATAVPISSIQAARDPGYQRPPVSQPLFFGDRGSESFKSVSIFDASMTWTVPVYKAIKPYLKFEAFNLFNNQKLVTWDTSIFPDAAGPVDDDGLPTRYVQGTTFGKPTGIFNYAGAREVFLSVGFRF
jgi:hypothetical protein